MKKLILCAAYMLMLPIACLFFGSCQKEVKEENQRKELESYITNTLKAPIDEQNGVYFVLLDTSPTQTIRVRSGDMVEFIYLAWAFRGSEFATNDDSMAVRYGLTPTLKGAVQVGVGALIAGLDRGLQRMALGDEGLILFPFTLGYGEEYMGLVKPESALIFEVWITKVN